MQSLLVAKDIFLMPSRSALGRNRLLGRPLFSFQGETLAHSRPGSTLPDIDYQHGCEMEAFLIANVLVIGGVVAVGAFTVE